MMRNRIIVPDHHPLTEGHHEIDNHLEIDNSSKTTNITQDNNTPINKIKDFKETNHHTDKITNQVLIEVAPEATLDQDKQHHTQDLTVPGTTGTDHKVLTETMIGKDLPHPDHHLEITIEDLADHHTEMTIEDLADHHLEITTEDLVDHHTEATTEDLVDQQSEIDHITIQDHTQKTDPTQEADTHPTGTTVHPGVIADPDHHTSEAHPPTTVTIMYTGPSSQAPLTSKTRMSTVNKDYTMQILKNQDTFLKNHPMHAFVVDQKTTPLKIVMFINNLFHINVRIVTYITILFTVKQKANQTITFKKTNKVPTFKYL